MRFFYKIATNSYFLMLHALSPINQKARKWVDGRKDVKDQLKQINVSDPLIWFHCASLGEFEQGKPVMEAFKNRHPNWLLLVTFFSPSGYEVRKNYGIADYVLYLPKETSSNVDLFLTQLKPRIAVFVKYEFWYGYMSELNKRHIPMVFLSSTFREKQLFFRFYGTWFLNQLKAVKMFFVQDLKSKILLQNHEINQVEVSGDTRFDRVIETVESNEDIVGMDAFKGDDRIIVFGSAWLKETEYAIQLINNLPKGWKVIYAPHEMDLNQIDKFEKDISQTSIRFSEINSASLVRAQVMILDTVGHLARVYKYGDVAFVGGGYIDGIHNILEPLAFGLPVFFGPNHSSFWEADDAIKSGVGFEIKGYEYFEELFFGYVDNVEELEATKVKCISFIKERAGATKIVSEFLNKIGQIISCQI